MKNIFYLLIIILLCSSVSISQEGKKVKYHAFSGTLLFGPEAGVTLGFTDYKEVKPEIIGRGVIEYFFPTTSSGIFGIKAFISGGFVGGKDNNRTPTMFRTNLLDIGGGFSYNFSIAEAVFPYIFAGASYLMFNPKDNDGNKLPLSGPRTFKDNEATYHGEIGVRFLLSPSISFNINVGGQLSSHDNWDAQSSGQNDFLLQVRAGLGLSLFAKHDSDNDGITDDKDQCPETPAGVLVDDFGCPLDADGDGVPDYLDKCPNTEPGMEVDENGCTIDTDGDGVPDKLDKCPNTPKGEKVNELGCPDSDGDGVYDNNDKCPGTPTGAPVDANGCPKDSDGDGVPDYLDKCPNTPAGTQVDEVGCAKADTVVKEIILKGDTNFEFNKAELLPAAYPILNDLAATMKKNPNTRWRIEGHTDAIGSDSYNMDLSRRRAESVLNYMLTQGIDRSRLEVVPLGESQPVATNDTQEGRAMNRRVEIKMIE